MHTVGAHIKQQETAAKDRWGVGKGGRELQKVGGGLGEVRAGGGTEAAGATRTLTPTCMDLQVWSGWHPDLQDVDDKGAAGAETGGREGTKGAEKASIKFTKFGAWLCRA